MWKKKTGLVAIKWSLVVKQVTVTLITSWNPNCADPGVKKSQINDEVWWFSAGTPVFSSIPSELIISLKWINVHTPNF